VDAVKTRSAGRADIVLPGALLAEKRGTVVNTEGRVQEIAPAAAALAAWNEGDIAAELARRVGDGTEPGPVPVYEPQPGGRGGELPGEEYPFLAALDTTLFWNSHALIAATATAWREARSLFADFPPGCVTLNPDDARALKLQYAGSVTVTSPSGSITLPARLHARMLPGTVWIAMPCWERCGVKLGALDYDTGLRVPIFRPRAVRVSRPQARA